MNAFATHRRRFRFSLLASLAAAAVIGGIVDRGVRWADAARDANLVAADSKPEPKADGGGRPGIYETGQYAVDLHIRAAAAIQAKPVAEAAEILLEMARRHEDKRTIADDRVLFLCRMLFTPKPGRHFRFLANGSSTFVGDTGDADWPLAPIELVDGVPLLVARTSGFVAGQALESAQAYVGYCLSECDWNPLRYQAKTAAEKEAALAKLLASPKWKEALNADDREFLAAQIKRPEPGKPVTGLAPSLDRAAQGVIEITFRNAEKAPIFLNLGEMFGGMLSPEQLHLIVTAASGKSRKLEFAPRDPETGLLIGAIAGRVDDFLVPLMPGAKYTITFALTDFIDADFESTIVAGEKVRAVFQGVAPRNGNGDRPGFIPGLPFWTDEVESAAVAYAE